MNDQPLVSIIMPFLNTPEAYMRAAIESILAQTYAHWELWLVDDGSTGRSSALARDYAASHPAQIYYLEHPEHMNRGISASRQLAFDQAAGHYITFLDADDIWLPDKLAAQVVLIEARPEVGMLYGNTRYWYSWNPASETEDFVPALGYPDQSVISGGEALISFVQGQAAVPCTCAVIIRSDLLQAVGGFEAQFTGMYEDQALYAKVCLHTQVLACATIWDQYRQYPESLSALEAHSGTLAQHRRYYLHWLADYVHVQADINQPTLSLIIRRELWLISHPLWLKEQRRAVGLLRWLKKWLLRLEAVLLPLPLRKRIWRIKATP